MDKKNLVGIIISALGAFLGIIVNMILFTLWYEPMQHAEASSLASGLLGAEGCILAVQYVLPVISDMIVLSGLLFAVCIVGYAQDKEWAPKVSILAIVLGLISFWPMVPAMATNNPPMWTMVFGPQILIYFVLMLVIVEAPLKNTLLGLIAGMAYVTAFMNGVAAYNRIIVTDMPVFVLIQRLNWIAAFGLAIVTLGVLLNYEKHEGLRMVGLGSAILEGIVGTMAGLLSPFGGGFSMFLLAPMLAIALIPFLITPTIWEKFFER